MEKRALIKKGAEAELYGGEWLGYDVVFKRRVSKGYRNPDLDSIIRSSRTSLESKLLGEAKRLGVPAPVVYFIDRQSHEIVMSRIQGAPVKNALAGMSGGSVGALFERIGEQVGRLHAGGVVHGDLTTSNMIICGGDIFFIDFGLGEYTRELEARGVDIHLMRRTLESSHHSCAKAAYDAFIKGYCRTMGSAAAEVLARAAEVRRRGRYVEGDR